MKKGTDSAGDWDFISCPECQNEFNRTELSKNAMLCPECNHHLHMPARERVKLVVDAGTFSEWEKDLTSVDPLNFKDRKTYMERIRQAQEKTGLHDGCIIGEGNINGTRSVFCFLDFEFMGGTMGSVVGEKVSYAFSRAREKKLPVISVVNSGGARMQEGMLSLMQMAKTASAAARHDRSGLLYLSVQADPTTGGISASFSSLGDVIISEPGALVGFVGPRVIEQVFGERLPPESHTAEFLKKHGMIDIIEDRKKLKGTLSCLVSHLGTGGKPKVKKYPAPKKKKIGKKDAWETVLLARRPDRPTSLSYIEYLIDDFVELHGDRNFGDDPAIIIGVGTLEGIPVAVIGEERGRNDEEREFRRHGMARPEGYRKALRMMELATKFNIPLLTFVDTPGAYPGFESEQRGIAMTLAQCLATMSSIPIPVICSVIGEGGSGGAIALAVGDAVLMQENAIYSVISPEGAASILWGDADKAEEVAGSLKLTAPDLLNLNIIDQIVPEPVGGAGQDFRTAAGDLKSCLLYHLGKLLKKTPSKLLSERFEKFESMGVTGHYWQQMIKYEIGQALDAAKKKVGKMMSRK
ncbi:MAG: acetyl-CoA carboxylase carboxyltransferase subunit alpha [Chloroflexi bacterium]|nr:acetyl-CoA carboxylase carboxyltransferase subunit alpha [Chloroflexota bacterium]